MPPPTLRLKRCLTFKPDPDPDAEVNVMNEALIQASKEGNTEEIESLLANVAQVNAATSPYRDLRTSITPNPTLHYPSS